MNKYNNTYSTIKITPINVGSSAYINFGIKNSDIYPNHKVGGHARISKYKNTFTKRYVLNWSEEVFVIKKVKNTVPWTYAISDLNSEETVGMFYEKEKVIKRKDDKLYVKWKSFDNSFNSWIDKNDS